MNKTLLMEAYLSCLFEAVDTARPQTGVTYNGIDPNQITDDAPSQVPAELKELDNALKNAEVQVILQENPGFSIPIKEADAKFKALYLKYPVVEIAKDGHTFAKRAQGKDGTYGPMTKVDPGANDPVISDNDIWKFSGLAAKNSGAHIYYAEQFYPELDAIINEAIARLKEAFGKLLEGYTIKTSSGKVYNKKELISTLKELNGKYSLYLNTNLKAELAKVFLAAYPDLKSNNAKLKSLVFNYLVKAGAAKPLNRKPVAAKPEPKYDAVMDSYINVLTGGFSLVTENVDETAPSEDGMIDAMDTSFEAFEIQPNEQILSHIERAKNYLKNIDSCKKLIEEINKKYKDVLIQYFDVPGDVVDMNDYKSHNKVKNRAVGEQSLKETLEKIKQVDRGGSDNIQNLRQNGLVRFAQLMRIFKGLLLQGGRYAA